MRAFKFFLLLSLIVVMGFETSQAYTRKVKDIDGDSESTGDAWATSTFVPPSDIGMRIAKSGSAGVGTSAGIDKCYRAVKYIIADALGKNRDCVRGNYMTEGSAKDAGTDLLRIGFVLDKSKCNTPGAVRVYKGVKIPGVAADAGTIHGHAEVVGDDGMFHSFLALDRPIDQKKPGERVLTGCYYPDADKIANGPLNNCPAVGYRSLRIKKNNNQSGAE